MSGHFIWDAIVDLSTVFIVLSALCAATWWSVVEVLAAAKRYLPRVVSRVRERVKRERD